MTALCTLFLFEPKLRSEWATLEAGYQLPTQSVARNGTGKFYTIFYWLSKK